MENKRILIREDRAILAAVVADLKLFTPALNELKAAYQKLELGQFNNEVYKQILGSSQDPAAVTVYQAYFDILNTSLDAAGLTRDSLRKVHVDQADLIYQEFEEALKALKIVNPNPYGHRSGPVLKIDNISFIDGKFQVSAMDEEDILETHCRIYLENRQEQEIYLKLKAVRDSLNDFYTYMNDVAVSHELGDLSALDYTGKLTNLSSLQNFITDDDVKQVIPEGIKWLSEMFARATMKRDRPAANQVPVEKDRPHDHVSILKMNKEIKEHHDRERFAEKRRIHSELNNK